MKEAAATLSVGLGVLATWFAIIPVTTRPMFAPRLDFLGMLHEAVWLSIYTGGLLLALLLAGSILIITSLVLAGLAVADRRNRPPTG